MENTIGFRNLVKEQHDRLGLPGSFAYIRKYYDQIGDNASAQVCLLAVAQYFADCILLNRRNCNCSSA